LISFLGRALILAALFMAATGVITGWFAGRSQDERHWRTTKRLAYGFSFTVILANLLMVYALVTHDFSVAYVAQVGSRSTPLYYTIISLWSSLEGSILFWGGVLGLYTAALTWTYRGQHKQTMPYTLCVLLAIAVFFTFLIASVANPFAPMSPVPMDGPGPNPLLQNHWLMAYHPPTLYLGYVGMAVPFSMACGSLLAGRLDSGWMTPLRRWFLIPWMFLTCGIMMGGWWSYEVLGWGGYWAWDPVENASFMPWLTGTAFLHSAMVYQRKGLYRTWTLSLVMSTFLLTILGTFMTRSGVFNSVHSFTQSEIGPIFLGFLGVCLLFSIVLLAVAEPGMEQDKQPAENHLFSRETAILLQNLLFAAFTFTVLLGTVYPLVIEAVYERKVSVGEPYFNRMALPIGLLIVFLMGVGPAIPWGKMNPSAAWKHFLPPVAFALIIGTLGVLLPSQRPGPFFALACGICAFALWVNTYEMLLPFRKRLSTQQESPPVAIAWAFTRNRRRFGGQVAHLGVILAVVAIAFSSAFKVEKDFTLRPGEAGQLADVSVIFEGSRSEQEPHRRSVIGRFLLKQGDAQLSVQEPRLNFYTMRREPIGTPAVYTTATRDIYLSLMKVEADGSFASFRVIIMPMMVWLWISILIIAAGTLLAILPKKTPANTA